MTEPDAITQAEGELVAQVNHLVAHPERKEALIAAARNLALEYGAALLEAAGCDERPERFFDPCIHREGQEAGTRGTRICQLALRERLEAMKVAKEAKEA